MNKLPKDIVDIIYLYMFVHNNGYLNIELEDITGMIRSKVDLVYCTQGKYYNLYSRMSPIGEAYDHKYRRCRNCKNWIISTRALSSSGVQDLCLCMLHDIKDNSVNNS